MISVHRIYLGRSWVASGEAGRLLSLFDELPEFLHAVVSLPDSGSEIETGDSVQRRAAVKVAMTQSHVALMWGGSEDPAPDWTEHELHVAGAGFRSRIPVLAVVAPGNEPASPIIRRLADRTVGWSSLEIARAVQERIELEQLSISLSREDRAAHRAIASAAPDHGHMERRLPLTEIVAAYDRLKAGRTGKLQSS
jgi:hypothetical protein